MGDRYPEPGSGIGGAWDRLVGPGASGLENAGSAAFAAVGACIGLTAASRDWGLLKRATAALMAADLFGGVWANATPSAVRWYHGRGQGVREMVAFSALHLHPFLVSAFYREHDRGFALGNYTYLLLATATTAGTPPPYRRAVALALCCVAVWLDTAVWRPPPGLGWFAPAYYIKLLASHAAGQAPGRQDPS